MENIFRLGLAALLGGLIGYERQYQNKSAGLRTNILVCVGSCLMMIVSQRVVSQVNPSALADPSRIAAQIVSGIGFLGAGAIIKEGDNVIGLTTAACIWVVAGVGMAVGIGYYWGAIVCSLIVFIALRGLIYMNIWLKYHYDLVIEITARETDSEMEVICNRLHDVGIEIKSMRMDAKNVQDNTLKIKLYAGNKNNITKMELAKLLTKLDNVLSAKIHQHL